uniref:Thyrotropin-releasing hormone-degrading ectoenzyme n=1 Tax=Cacopsylla melanoneura TaxID=428564 RepID=A0A8D9AHE2_9HEMI
MSVYLDSCLFAFVVLSFIPYSCLVLSSSVSSELFALEDSSRSTTVEVMDIFGLLTHELSHQWFGNLATPTWWDHAWIKESLADYFEYFAIDWVRQSRRYID